MKHYILNEKKEVISVNREESYAWQALDFNKTRQVGLTKINKDVRVSTVFLSVDHGFYAGGADSDINYQPIVFESMVFKDGEDIDCIRYRTFKEAKAGHKRVVERMKKKFVKGKKNAKTTKP